MECYRCAFLYLYMTSWCKVGKCWWKKDLSQSALGWARPQIGNKVLVLVLREGVAFGGYLAFIPPSPHPLGHPFLQHGVPSFRNYHLLVNNRLICVFKKKKIFKNLFPNCAIIFNLLVRDSFTPYALGPSSLGFCSWAIYRVFPPFIFFAELNRVWGPFQVGEDTCWTQMVTLGSS